MTEPSSDSGHLAAADSAGGHAGNDTHANDTHANDTHGVETLAIIGTGLMGGSLGLASLKKGLAKHVRGFDLEAERTASALERGAITFAAGSIEEAVDNAQIVIIATPVGAITEAFEQVAKFAGHGLIVSDVGSTKATIVGQISDAVPSGIHFVGGHPIAGSEKDGIDAATPDLYAGCLWVLTPTPETDPAAYRTLMNFITGLGARVISLDPTRHDEAMALTSHLPQLISSTLMGFAADVSASPDGLPLLAAGGFLDMTRISGSSPNLWLDIVRDNRLALLNVLRRFRTALATAEEELAAEDWGRLGEMLNSAREARRSLSAKPGVQPEELVEIRIPVPDRAGVLAEVTNTVGEAGINIEDIDIVHSPEGGRGVVHLSVAGRPNADEALRAIAQKGFSPELIR
ncbi:MAG: prephenate dehydrogenase/arogenate dehydrogenase family protein [Actinomycetota bacterium]